MVVLIKNTENEKVLFKIGLLFRLIFLFTTPALSQDFYRFIWDGNIILQSLNPYQFKPNDIIETVVRFPNANYLYQKMGSLSASHFSNYPPINQFFFTIAAFFGGKSVFVSTLFLRVFIILADVGIYFYGKKMLLHFNINTKAIFWYFLNPLVILELTGNLHFEGVMLFFFCVGLYFLIQKKNLYAGLFIAISISVKLLPLLLLPLFLKNVGIKKSILFYTIIVSQNLLFFLPFINNNLIANYTDTISLWFTNFEFNASFYYLIREIGFYVKGYNIIGVFGVFSPIFIVLIVLFFALYFKNKSVLQVIISSLFVLTLYFFISTTVHPWYIINLVLLSVFTKYKFPIVWSFAIILSYYSYSVFPYKENYFLLLLEYLVVFSSFYLEVLRHKKVKFD